MVPDPTVSSLDPKVTHGTAVTGSPTSAGSIQRRARSTQYPMPDPAARDPHTMVFDKDGAMWFTVQGGNFVGRLTPELGEVGLIAVPTPRARPYGIELDSNNTPWVVEFGTNKIASINKEGMTLTEHELPSSDARPRRIAITSDDMIWYVDYARGYLGRLDPSTGQVQEWANPGGSQSRPYAMTADDRDRLWFFETNPGVNRLVGFDPEREVFFSVTELESGGGTVQAHGVRQREAGDLVRHRHKHDRSRATHKLLRQQVAQRHFSSRCIRE